MKYYQESSLENAGIDEDNLGIAEMQLELKDENYHDIDNPTVKMDFFHNLVSSSKYTNLDLKYIFV